MDNLKKTAVVTLLAAVFVQVAFLASGKVSFAIDEYTYLSAAKAFAAGNYAGAPEVARFPLLPFLVSLAGNANLEIASRLLNLAVAALGVLFTFLLAKKLSGKRAAWFAALLVATNPLYLFFAGKTLTEPLFTTLFVALAYFLVKSRENAWWLAAAGAAAALATLSRYSGVALVPIGFLFLWKEKLLQKTSKQLVVAAIVFVAVMLPFFWLSATVTDDALGFVKQFFSSQSRVDATFFSLPDKIPVPYAPNIAAVFFVLAAAFPLFLAAIASSHKKLLQKGIFEPLLFAFAFAVVLDVYAFFNFALVRYIAVVVPFVAIAAASWVALNENKKAFGKTVGWLLIVACGVNLVFAAGLLGYFNLSYAKHVDYREVGLFSKENCGSAFTNIPSVLEHYVGGAVSHRPQEFFSPPDCVVDSGYDAWNYRNAFPGYSEVFKHGAISVGKKV